MNTVASSKAQKNNKAPANNHKKDQDLTFLEGLLNTNLKAAANILQIDIQTLCGWIKSQHHLSSLAKYTLLRAIIDYDLNPFKEEIILIESNQQDQSTWPFITIEGWIKLINQHPQFCGIEFTSPSEEEEKHPEWMECSIYRHDRIKPITIREYLVEVVTEQAIWKERPHRMLRYRTMAQCAKLAFGICIADSPNYGKPQIESRITNRGEAKFKLVSPDRVSTLKELLSGANTGKD